MKHMTQHKTGAQETRIKQMSLWTGEKVLALTELPTWHFKNHYLILAKNYMAEKWQT